MLDARIDEMHQLGYGLSDFEDDDVVAVPEEYCWAESLTGRCSH